MLIDGRIALSDEQRLLLTCSQFPSTTESVFEDISVERLDWDVLLWMASAHRLTGLLLKCLEQAQMFGRVPSIPRRILEHYQRQAVALDVKYRMEIARVTELLRASGLRGVFLKGAALIPLIYGDSATRGLADIDILLPSKEGAGLAFDALVQQLGYRCLADERYQVERIALINQYAPLTHDGITIDLHFDLAVFAWPFCMDAGGLIGRAHAVTYRETEVLIPSLEDLLVHLCQHLHQHHVGDNDYSLRRHADVRNLVSRYQKAVDWKVFANRVHEQRLEVPVAYALYYSQAIYPPFLPSGLLDAVMPVNFAEEKDAMRWHKMMSDEIVGYWRHPYLWRLFEPQESIRHAIGQAITEHVTRVKRDAAVRSLEQSALVVR